MAFPGTHTPTRAEIVGKARHQCPMRKVRGVDAYYLDDDTKAHFIRLYPTTLNRDMMRIFGISFSTLQRFKRELGLEKKMQTIRHKQAQIAKQICEENGWYDSLRGKAPSEACMAAARKMRAEGFHPLRQLKKKNYAKYKRVMAKRAEARKELERKERLRANWGLERQTNLHRPYDPFGYKRTSFRNTCKQVGYIPGSAYDQAERWVIYYTPETKRGKIREEHGQRLGFRFKPIDERAA